MEEFEHTYDPEDGEGGYQPTESDMEGLSKWRLQSSITESFQSLNAQQLREWYVDNFVLDQSNLSRLVQLGGSSVLTKFMVSDSWPSIEHAAIGSKMVYAMDPDIFDSPDFMEPDAWNDAAKLTQYILRVMAPWMSIRYDPETENWFSRIEPGQWKRLGKGKPGEAVAEEWIRRWLNVMSPKDTAFMDLLQSYGIDPMRNTGRFDADTIINRVTGSGTFHAKALKSNTLATQIRKYLEAKRIMQLDSSTLNRIRTMAPFANGMLSLVKYEYYDVASKTNRVVSQGTLLPMSVEFMVTNANSLKWNDHDKDIPNAVSMVERVDFAQDWGYVEELEDVLLLRCPTYWSFLTHAFPEHEERSAFLRLLGAAMYGTNLKIVAAMIGEPNAGKDTVVNWLSYLMPGQVASLPFSAFTPHGDDDRGFAPLMGARVAIVSGEVGEGRGSKLLAEKIKTVSSGGGTLRVAEKYEKPTTIFYDGMLFLQGNSVPTIAGGDKALYQNRLVAVEFKHPFPLQARSYEALYRAESPTFAQVLFLNYMRYEYKGAGMHGIDPPQSWRDFRKEFENAANAHGFLEACIIQSTEPIPTTQFHRAMTAMVEKFGSPYKIGDNYWPKAMRRLGFETDKDKPNSIRKQVQVNGKRALAYYLTVDAERSDGAFDQSDWEQVLADAAVTQ